MLYAFAEDPTIRGAIYVRTSTRHQLERRTALSQLDLLRRFASSQGVYVTGEFVDDAVPGTRPLSERIAGASLVQRAAAGEFSVVLVQAYDRLGRSRDVVLDAVETLRASGVEVVPAAQALSGATAELESAAAFAEYERICLGQRVIAGRDRALRDGRWTNAPVPFGYDVDADRRLTASTRVVGGVAEAELVRSIFERIANGSSTVAEARRLNTLAVEKVRRYTNGRIFACGSSWLAWDVQRILRNETYLGKHAFESRCGRIESLVPALVGRDLWEAARAGLARNRPMAVGPRRTYPLRGKIKCGGCGRSFIGNGLRGRDGEKTPYYRCMGGLAAIEPDPERRCRSKLVAERWLDKAIREGRPGLVPGPLGYEMVEVIEIRTVQNGPWKSAIATIRYADGSTHAAECPVAFRG